MITLARLVSTLLLLPLTAGSGIAVARNVDHFNGGGQIVGTPTGSKGTFGFTAHNTDLPHGHMTYIDHAAVKIAVHSTAITSYTIVNATTRTITGTCKIGGVRGFSFTATVVDNGEPGTADTFSIALSSGYAASGILVHGNVQVHAVP
ncbi:MAG TPA: post-COAP-1 domain-containing protein [Planctomycetota bacterium]|nr:post-COAP-1 domain-containing protein [Planctomycetota bacterium]